MFWKVLEQHRQLGFAELNTDGSIVRCTHAFGVLVGYDPVVLAGQPFYSLVSPMDQSDMRLRIEAISAPTAQQHQIATLSRFVHPDGQPVWCTLDMVRLPEEDPNAIWVGMCRSAVQIGDAAQEAKVIELQAKLDGVYNKLIQLTLLLAQRGVPTVNLNTTNQTSSGGGAINQAGENDVRQ